MFWKDALHPSISLLRWRFSVVKTSIYNYENKIKNPPFLTDERLAGVAGFEPTNGGTKIRCLTTWRHPNNANNNITKF